MDSFATLLPVAVLWTLAVLTPGPNFLATVQASLSRSRTRRFHTVLGIGLGTGLWGLAGFFGIHALFVAAPWMYLSLKVVGGGYLVWMGSKLIWASRRAAALGGEQRMPSGWAAFRFGLVTNLANPKTAIFVTGLFATTMPAGAPVGRGLAAVAIMAAISMAWYGLVATVLASDRISRAYARSSRWLERAAGTLFILFGARLIASPI